MTMPVELYVPYAPDRSAIVFALDSPTHGYCISMQQLIHAKRTLGVPDWSVVYLRRNCSITQLRAVSFHSDSDEVITCAS